MERGDDHFDKQPTIEMWFQIATEDMNALKRRMSIYEFPQEREDAIAYAQGQPGTIRRENATLELPQGLEPLKKRIPPNLYEVHEVKDEEEDEEDCVLTENY